SVHFLWNCIYFRYVYLLCFKLVDRINRSSIDGNWLLIYGWAYADCIHSFWGTFCWWTDGYCHDCNQLFYPSWYNNERDDFRFPPCCHFNRGDFDGKQYS